MEWPTSYTPDFFFAKCLTFNIFSSIFMLFLLRPPSKWCYHDVTMHAVHFLRDFKLYDESVLPVTKKEWKGKGKWTIGPWMKNGQANPCSINILFFPCIFYVLLLKFDRSKFSFHILLFNLTCFPAWKDPYPVLFIQCTFCKAAKSFCKESRII